MKNIVIFLILVLLIVGIISLFKKPTSAINTPPQTLLNISPHSKAIQAPAPMTPTKHQYNQANKTDTPPDRSHKNNHTYILYETLSIEEAALSTKARPSILPIAAIQLHSDIYTLVADDTLSFPNIEGFDYTITIDNVQQNEDGSVSTTGYYHDEGIRYTTTITHASNETFISLSTAEGSYEIETTQAIGYIYKTKDIRSHLQKNNAKDMILLPIPSPASGTES